jgi:hypothetical protein
MLVCVHTDLRLLHEKQACFGDLEGRPGGISRNEMGLFYSKFVDSFPVLAR